MTPVPLLASYAHNDYQHPRPLLDALDCGFCQIEADVHLVDGELMIAHDAYELRPGKTLEAMYLRPLRDRVRAGGGRVYPGGPTVVLAVDVKTDAEQTYAAVRDLLGSYADMLTTIGPAGRRAGAVTVLMTGNQARQTIAAEAHRLVVCDGLLADLDEPEQPVDLVPQVNGRWDRTFTWRGDGPLAEHERFELRRIVERAHGQGRRVRFWSAPDTPAAWTELLAAGVDLICTDDLCGLRDFLLHRCPR